MKQNEKCPGIIMQKVEPERSENTYVKKAGKNHDRIM